MARQDGVARASKTLTVARALVHTLLENTRGRLLPHGVCAPIFLASFLAFWLRSSVVSVLISVNADISS